MHLIRHWSLFALIFFAACLGCAKKAADKVGKASAHVAPGQCALQTDNAGKCAELSCEWTPTDADDDSKGICVDPPESGSLVCRENKNAKSCGNGCLWYQNPEAGTCSGNDTCLGLDAAGCATADGCNWDPDTSQGDCKTDCLLFNENLDPALDPEAACRSNADDCQRLPPQNFACLGVDASFDESCVNNDETACVADLNCDPIAAEESGFCASASDPEDPDTYGPGAFSAVTDETPAQAIFRADDLRCPGRALQYVVGGATQKEWWRSPDGNIKKVNGGFAVELSVNCYQVCVDGKNANGDRVLVRGQSLKMASRNSGRGRVQVFSVSQNLLRPEHDASWCGVPYLR